jgi:hypothetical protein
MPTFTTSIQLVLEGLTRAIRQEKEMKVIQTRKEEVKLFLFAGNTILCVENPNDSTKKKKKKKPC